MATKKAKQEARHRWTTPERQRLIELSRPYTTLGEAADGVYVEMAQPRQSVYAQLYALALRGKVPWLSTSKPAREHDGLSPAFTTAIRELIRVMRVESITDVLVSDTGDYASIETVTRTKRTTTLEMR